MATRRRIVEAAGRFFVRDGYATTTLQQIADEAGVAVQTVYFHFGNKRTLLKELVDIAGVGDDQPVALLDRPWVQEVRTAPSGLETVAVWLRASREIFGRVAPILRIVRDAAGSDPEMAVPWEINQQQRHTAHRAFAEILDAKDGLRPELAVDEAADILLRAGEPGNLRPAHGRAGMGAGAMGALGRAHDLQRGAHAAGSGRLTTAGR